MNSKRKIYNSLLPALVFIAAAFTVLLLVIIIGFVLFKGLPELSWSLLTSVPSVIRKVEGILPYIVNTLYVVMLSILIVLPLGVGAAVYLTEYAKNRRLIAVIEFTTEILAGIPSIIYGLVGMLVFNQKLGLGSCLISGSLTLVIMTLPTIIRTTEESLKTVPQSYREGALGLGAAKWHIVRTLVLPCSLDGIVTGCILAIGRIVGESAALLFTAGCGKVLAQGIIRAYTSSGATLSVALYMTVFEEGNFDVGYAIAAVLMILVLALNLLAKFSSKKLKRKF
ncbi:phosphate ABC transporter permease PstA [Fournierella massiliensis]|nr:phosphate ABC transporter permease PstA [Fournierella massiliensis]MCF2557512.1 phosphate ABC transporter permease PstA [Fournierella massiliensis]